MPIETIDRILLVDDSYIALNISRNIALGRGPLGDSIHVTNGYQPLYVWLMVPVYWLLGGDRELPIHLALTFLSVCNVLAGVFAFKSLRIVTDNWTAVTALLLWSFWGPVIQIGLNGLETSLAVALLAASFHFYVSRTRASSSAPLAYVQLGLLLGLAILARIDNAFWAGLIGLHLVCTHRREPSKALRMLAPLALGTLIVLGPWLLHNAFFFGALLPESGEGTRFQTTIQGTDGSILDKGTWLKLNLRYAFSSGFIAGYSCLLAIALPVFLHWRSSLRASEPAQAAIRDALDKHLLLLAYPFILIVSYSALVGARWYFYRYFFPIRFAFALLLGLIVFTIDRVLGPMVPKRYLLANAATCGLAVFLLGSLPINLRSEIGGYREIGVWARDNLPRGAVVGATQSGSLAYFADDVTIVNMDGKINGEALAALKARRVLDYARERHIQYFLDWSFNVQKLIVNRSARDTLVLLKVISAQNGDWNLYERR